jgi:flagellar motility protein MotE (MotC chaperone)
VVFVAILLLAKILFSSLYLKEGGIPISSGTLALAEDSTGSVSTEELDQVLRNKEKELKEKEALLKMREDELLPLKKEIEAKVADLNELQERLTAFAKDLAEREKALRDAKIAHLVNLYEAMEPTQAAAIMEKLNMETVVRILGNMKGKSAGKILAAMKPEKGALVSEKLSQLE